MICQAEWHWRCHRERTQWHSNELQLSIRSSQEEFRATTAGEVLLLRESREPEVVRAGAVMRARNRGSRGAARTGWQQRRPEVEVDENLILQTALTSPRGQRLVTEQVRAACEEERTCRAVATRQNRESGSQSGTRHASSFVLVCYRLPPPSSIYAVWHVGQSSRQGTRRAGVIQPPTALPTNTALRI